MSLKNSKTEKKKPRAMPVEAIVTRFKSAQQKRLLEKEQAKSTKKSKNINSPRKSQPPQQPKTEKKSPRLKTVKKSNKNVNEKKIEDTQVENKEYYPTKLKRKVLNARRFLTPKSNCKVIFAAKSVNKRKRHVPQRDMKYVLEQMQRDTINSVKSPKQKTQSPDLSITEMVRIIEENETLDDEDLLEILTCPSPVWWEEPPDGYIEEALFSQDRPAETISVKNQIKEEENKDTKRKRNQEDKQEVNNNDNQINVPETLDIDINNRDKIFINKRCKLEALLGSIKNKDLKSNINKIKSNKNESDSTNMIKTGAKEAVELEEVKEMIKESKAEKHPDCADEGLIDFEDEELNDICKEVTDKTHSELIKEDEANEISELVKGITHSECMDKDLIDKEADVKDKSNDVIHKINSECVDEDLIDFEEEEVNEICKEVKDETHSECIDEDLIDLRDEDVKDISDEVKHEINSECTDEYLVDFEKKEVNEICKEIKDKTHLECADKNVIDLRDADVKNLSHEVKDKRQSECMDENLINLKDAELKGISDAEKGKTNYECTDEDLMNFEEEEENDKCNEVKDKINSEFADVDSIDIYVDEKVNDISNDVKDKTNSDCADEDLNEFRDDEILRHLENLEIPIEKTIKITNLADSKDDDDSTRRVSTESNISEKNMSEEYLDMSLLDDDHDDKRVIDDDKDKREIVDDDDKREIVDDDDKREIVDDDDKREIVDDDNASYNNKTINSESSQPNELKLEEQHDDLNVTSNRNNKIQCDLNKTNDKHNGDNDETINKIKLDKVNMDKYKKKGDHTQDFELVTVYKIINTNTLMKEMDETNRQINKNIDTIKDKDKTDGRINSYYKHCKRVPTLKLKLVKELTKDKRDFKCKEKFHRVNKSITISESDNVKYCFVCSSIFDSEKCNYCLRKTLKRKLNEYCCDVCGLNVNTKQEMIEHLSVHIEGVE